MKEPHELWHHEETLINHRLTWLLASQALLFAACTLAQSDDKLGELARIIAKVGHYTSGFIFLGIGAAIAAQINLSVREGKFYPLLVTTIAEWITAVALPLTFVAGWVALGNFAA